MARMAFRDEPFEELLRRARGGDRGALEKLFQRAQRKLRGAAKQRVDARHPGGARPSDIEQETAERVLRKFDTFEGNTEAEWFEWIERIVATRAVQSVRNARRKKRAIPGGLPLDAPEAEAAASPRTSPSQATCRNEEWRLLLRCLHELPDDQREAIKLRYLEECSFGEVAERMGKTQASVKGLVDRGIKAIQARMQEKDASSLIERLRALRPSK